MKKIIILKEYFYRNSCFFIFPFLFAVNEHYRGNRFRNQVVRQDFPTALSEQIKEKEVAEKQQRMYQQMMGAQAEADAIVARRLAEKLQREQEVDRHRKAQESEVLARRLQDELTIQPSGSSADHKRQQISPKPVTNELPIPPKNLGIKFNGQRRLFTDSEPLPSTSSTAAAAVALSSSSSHMNAVHAKDNSQLNYVSLELNVPKDSQKHLANHHATQYTQVYAHAHNVLASSPPDSHHYEHINLHSHTPEKTVPQAHTSQDYSFPSPNKVTLPPKPPKLAPTSPTKIKSKQYELPKLPPKAKDLTPANRAAQMALSADSFDFLMGNRSPNHTQIPDECDSLAVGGAAACSSQYDSERVYNSNAPNINRIDSVNDILSYDDDEEECEGATPVNVDRIRQLQELGVPADEILEINRRMTQQEKDEELARQLQQQEEQSITQEEKDRLIAIEAQDKELARMLQERVSTILF